MEKNYSREDHLRSWELEKQFNEQFKDKLIWHNQDWNKIDTYDSKEKNLPDFTVKNTTIKLELQAFDFAYHNVVLHARRFMHVDNVLGIYGALKDLKGTYHVLYDGTRIAWALLDGIDKKPIEEFAGRRNEWEKAYITNLNRYKQGSFNIWLMFQKA